MAKNNYTITQCNFCKQTITKRTRQDRKLYFCGMECYRSFQHTDEYKTIYAKKKTGKIKKCSVCSSEYYVQKSATTHKYCSKECYQKAHSLEYKYGEESVNKICEYCNKQFRVKGISGLESKCCSAKCGNALKSNRDKVLTCKVCGAQFCSVEFRKTGHIIRPHRETCSDKCLRTFYATDKNRKKKISKAFTGEKHPMWLGGRAESRDGRGSRWRHTREKCFEEKGEVCEICGISRTESKVKYGCDLHIDHIKAWHYFPKNEKHKANKIENLRPLCISCHTKHGDKADLRTKNERKKEYCHSN